MSSRILFLGEGALTGPARYLAAVLTWARLPFDHRPDGAKIPKTWRSPNRYRAVVLSDYRYRSFTPRAREWLVEAVTKGTGLLMIGGWASFTGSVGGYAGTPIESVLPVQCIPGDDRVNWASGSVLAKTQDHPILKGLSFENPPIVCGYHRVRVRPYAQTLLNFHDLTFRDGTPQRGAPHAGLVVRDTLPARSAAFLTDAAPHWAGGLVDWGKKRVRVPLGPGNTVEVGDMYLRFFSQLIRWVAR
jgi:uncharacterized membrane protein